MILTFPFKYNHKHWKECLLKVRPRCSLSFFIQVVREMGNSFLFDEVGGPGFSTKVNSLTDRDKNTRYFRRIKDELS